MRLYKSKVTYIDIRYEVEDSRLISLITKVFTLFLSGFRGIRTSVKGVLKNVYTK